MRGVRPWAFFSYQLPPNHHRLHHRRDGDPNKPEEPRNRQEAGRNRPAVAVAHNTPVVGTRSKQAAR